jgi:TIR domain-containing protein
MQYPSNIDWYRSIACVTLIFNCSLLESWYCFLYDARRSPCLSLPLNLMPMVGKINVPIQGTTSEKANIPTRNQIFISYSHRDKAWLEKLLTMLKPLERQELIKAWSDTLIKPGMKWKEEINKALASAKVAILLVSPDFIASDFIAKNELPPLLEAAKKEGLIILWIAISYSMYTITELGIYQAINNPAEPLDSLSPSQVNRELVSIAEQIKEIISNL